MLCRPARCVVCRIRALWATLPLSVPLLVLLRTIRNPGADATGLAWTKEFVDRNPQKA